MRKVVFLTVMPSPYVQDLFVAIAADIQIDLTVWYLEQEAPDTHWGAQTIPDYARVLPGRWYGVSGARVHWNPGIRKLIGNSDADLFVIVGYIGLTNQIAMRTLNRLGRPWVFWGEVPGFQRRGWLGSQIRSFLQRPLRHAKGIAAVGSKAVQAYRELFEKKNPSCQFANIPYHCRLEEFLTAGALRTRTDTVRFLYCGQLIERKGVDLLCKAFDRLVIEGHDVSLTLAGEGPLRRSLQDSLSPKAAARSHFLGFQDVAALPTIFRHADVFLLPSRHDGWGVVINQALAAGLPIISTTAVGAALDLVNNDLGMIVERDSDDALYRAMKDMLTKDIEAMSLAARSQSETISLDAGCETWVSFLKSVK
jgi:glycosyltransferase involved in cell wall biosynthesis